MYSFSKTSQRRLEECDPRIQLILHEAIKLIDFTIVTGHRGKEEQDRMFQKRYSKVMWPDGKHNSKPSLAVDIAPYIKPYGAITGHPDQVKVLGAQTGRSTAAVNQFIVKSYARLIGVIEAIAFEAGIDIRVGMDWDGDYDMLDQTFDDLMHIEINE